MVFSETDLVWQDFTSFAINTENFNVFKLDIEKHFREIQNIFVNVLSEFEILKASKFNKEIDRKRYIVSKYFLRILLSKFLSTEPDELKFGQTANKKPSINGIEFNVTHSRDYVIIAVSQASVGIDLEFINPSFDFKPLLANCFHPEEISYMDERGNTIRDFYTLWTRKESLLKATGEGLIDELDQLNCTNYSIERLNKTYTLNSYVFENNYILSIANSVDLSPALFWNY
ncbi:MAG: 4'-phosphopantetheinyl transferase superfamily protein [Chryseobacterium sp.]|nr:MAG: 4'-phosphopantetheinyl transferase superfamily protein [Chryseobacterium sp.]